jgi:hypothetical protein
VLIDNGDPVPEEDSVGVKVYILEGRRRSVSRRSCSRRSSDYGGISSRRRIHN